MKIINAFVFTIIFILVSCQKPEYSGIALIGKKEFISNIKYAPLKYSFDKNEYKSRMLLNQNAVISEQIIFKASINNSDGDTVPTTAFGLDFKHDPILKKIKTVKGSVPKINTNEIFINNDLASLTSLQPGDNISLFFTTADGRMDAKEMVVSGFYECDLDFNIDIILDINKTDSYLMMHNKITNYIISTDKTDRTIYEKFIEENNDIGISFAIFLIK